MRRDRALAALLAGVSLGASAAASARSAPRSAAAPAVLSVSASGTVSRVTFPGTAGQTWRQAGLSIAFGNPRRTVFETEIEAESRAATDVRISARATTRTAHGAYYVGGAVTPHAVFRDQWRVAAGGEARIGSRLQGSLDVRVARYRSGLTAGVEPALALRAGPTLTLTARAINLFDGGGQYRAGAALRADFAPRGAAAWFVSAARYPDREEDGVRQLSAVAAGVRADLGAHWQVRLTAAHEQRAHSYRRRSIGLALSYRPDPR